MNLRMRRSSGNVFGLLSDESSDRVSKNNKRSVFLVLSYRDSVKQKIYIGAPGQS